MHKLPHFFFALIVGTCLFVPSFVIAQNVDEVFNVDAVKDATGRDRVFVSLATISDHAYIYVDKTFFDSLTPIEKVNFNTKVVLLGGEFDAVIYPRLRALYGAEWNPGIDNDPHITIVFTNLNSSIGGYVDVRNEVSQKLDSRSNEREMLYLNSSLALSPLAKSYLAHEFVHLIEYNQRQRIRSLHEQPWLSEAMADYAPTFLGYNDVYSGSFLERRVHDFNTFPTDSLTTWLDQPTDVATASLFMHYVVGQYGKDLLPLLMQSSLVGLDNMNSALRRLGTQETFSSTFLNWIVATYVNGSVRGEVNRYAYRQPQLSYSALHMRSPLQYSVFESAEMIGRFLLPEGGMQWLKFIPGTLGKTQINTLHLVISDSNDLNGMRVPVIITTITGESRVDFFEIKNGTATFSVPDFGSTVLSAVVVPANQNFLGTFPAHQAVFAVKAFLGTGSSSSPLLKDGSLVRGKGDTKVYVLKNGSRRWIPSPEIFAGYGHLRWQDIIDVEPDVLNTFQESRLIRFRGDYRVYEISQDAQEKRWLDITSKEFDASGRRWDTIFEVNRNEFDRYRIGESLRT